MTDPITTPDPTAVPPPDPGNAPPEQWALNLPYVDAQLDALIEGAADPHALDPLLAPIAAEQGVM